MVGSWPGGVFSHRAQQRRLAGIAAAVPSGLLRGVGGAVIAGLAMNVIGSFAAEMEQVARCSPSRRWQESASDQAPNTPAARSYSAGATHRIIP